MRLTLIGLAVVIASAVALVWWQLQPRACPPDTEYTAPLVNAETNETIATFCVRSKEARVQVGS